MEKDECIDSDSSPDGNSEYTVEHHEGRGNWTGKFDFLLSCIGFAVGLGNIWRFPYLCYKNGGGAFFIPYLLMLVCGGVPILILEIGLGQYMSQGGLTSWKICPLFQGIGYASMIVVFLLNIYYIIIMAWGLYYFGMSLTSVLPWSHCNNEWNTDSCALSASEQRQKCNLPSNSTTIETPSSNDTFTASTMCTSISNISVDPVVEFWERKVLQITDSINDGGGIVPEIAICLLVVWVVVYFCIWKGVKWTGKVVYFTATFPYVMLLILLIRGVTLPGAADGIKYYLQPDFSRLKDPQVWVDGGTQIFFSYAIAIGGMIALGSYNKFNNNFYRDCIIISCVNTGTSIVGGIAVFSVLGFMANQQNLGIDEVAESGPGLVFIAYPKAVTMLPLSPLWSILFFFMLFLIGLDSQFVGVESFITLMSDAFPRVLYRERARVIFVAVYCMISFLLGLSMVSRGGMYVFQLFDYYSASGMVMLWLCFWESIVIGWIFGAERFYDVIELMIGYRINRWLHFCWKFFTPVISMGIFVFQVVAFKPLKYNNTYVYPDWAQGMGMTLAFLSMCCIPVFLVWKVASTPGPFVKRLKSTITPHLRKHQICRNWRWGENYDWKPRESNIDGLVLDRKV